jgi:hypothetical protein
VNYAPDLAAPTNRTPGLEPVKLNGGGQSSGGQRGSQPQTPPRRDGKALQQAVKPVLGAEASAELRNRLIAEVDNLGSGDDAAEWAHRCLREKNRLTALDARRVEDTFQARLKALTRNAPEKAKEAAQRLTLDNEDAKKTRQPNKGRRRSNGMIDKSALAFPEPRRVRDRDHVKYIAQQACLVCGRRPSDAHHLRFAQSRALARKVSDEFTVPVCRGHHREIHRCGDEAAWWKRNKVDPTVIARALWLETHPLAGGDGPTSGATSSVTTTTDVIRNYND